MMSVPGVDQVDARPVEVASIASGHGCVPGRGDAGDLHITNFHRTPASLLGGGDGSSGDRSRQVEGLHATVEVFVEELRKDLVEPLASAAWRQKFNTSAYLEYFSRCRQDRFGGLIIEPFHDGSIGCVPHQRGEHIGVEHDHDSLNWA